MRIDYFFELIEKGNEFKSLVGEVLKTKVSVSLNDNLIGTAQTLEQFWRIVGRDIKEIISEEEIQKTASVREFKVLFDKDGERNNIKLYVQ